MVDGRRMAFHDGFKSEGALRLVMVRSLSTVLEINATHQNSYTPKQSNENPTWKESKLRRGSDSASNEGSTTLDVTIILLPSCFEKILYHCYSPEIGTSTCAVKGDCKVHLDEKKTKSIKIIPR